MRYVVIHHSQNWVDGPAEYGFETLKKARQFIKERKLNPSYHQFDSIRVEVRGPIETYAPDKDENGLIIFKLSKGTT